MIRIHPSLTLFQRGAIGAAAALALISLTPGEARALTFNVRGQDYDITTFTGSYNSNSANFTLQNMPWWGDSSLAADFVSTVGGGMGYPNDPTNPTNSPFFAWKLDPHPYFPPDQAVYIKYTNTTVPGVLDGYIPLTDTYPEWAQAVAVPGPVPILGIPVVVAYCRKLKQRIKARRDTSSASSV